MDVYGIHPHLSSHQLTLSSSLGWVGKRCVAVLEAFKFKIDGAPSDDGARRSPVLERLRRYILRDGDREYGSDTRRGPIISKKVHTYRTSRTYHRAGCASISIVVSKTTHTHDFTSIKSSILMLGFPLLQHNSILFILYDNNERKRYDRAFIACDRGVK
jgi:hypothetical protein